MSSKSTGNRRWSLSARLTIWYIVASLTLAAFTMGGLYWWLRNYLATREEPILSEKIRIVREILRDRPDAVAELKEALELNSPNEVPIYIRVLDENGQARFATEGMDVILPPAVFESLSPSDPMRDSAKVVARDAISYRAVVANATFGSSGKKWTIQAARYNEHHKFLLANFRVGVLIMLALTAIACPLVAYLIARRGLRPLHDISETARHISSETLSERIEAAGYPVELGVLADTFNAMLDRLEDSFRRISQFSADIAHELRTPIHNLRGEAEVTLSRARTVDEYREALTSCLEETVRVSELIGTLLLLARVENPRTHLRREQVNLPDELTELHEYYADAASEHGITLSVLAGDNLDINVDRGLIRGAIGNLIANSLAYTPPGGTIKLLAEAENGYARVEVCDSGAGISSRDLPHVFDRFYRADRSRSSQAGSMGLGLAIVKGIMALHGGQVKIESELGEGTRVVLTFPREPSQREEIGRATSHRN